MDGNYLRKNLPLNYVEDCAFRKQSKYETRFSASRLRGTLLHLSEKVEERISDEMKHAGRGTIMYNAWSK